MKFKYTLIGFIFGLGYAIASVIIFFTKPNLLLAGTLSNPITILMYPALFLGVLPSWWIISSFGCYQKDCLGATAFASPFIMIILFSIIGLILDLLVSKFRKSTKN